MPKVPANKWIVRIQTRLQSWYLPPLKELSLKGFSAMTSGFRESNPASPSMERVNLQAEVKCWHCHIVVVGT